MAHYARGDTEDIPPGEGLVMFLIVVDFNNDTKFTSTPVAFVFSKNTREYVLSLIQQHVTSPIIGECNCISTVNAESVTLAFRSHAFQYGVVYEVNKTLGSSNMLSVIVEDAKRMAISSRAVYLQSLFTQFTPPQEIVLPKRSPRTSQGHAVFFHLLIPTKLVTQARQSDDANTATLGANATLQTDPFKQRPGSTMDWKRVREQFIYKVRTVAAETLESDVDIERIDIGYYAQSNYATFLVIPLTVNGKAQRTQNRQQLFIEKLHLIEHGEDLVAAVRVKFIPTDSLILSRRLNVDEVPGIMPSGWKKAENVEAVRSALREGLAQRLMASHSNVCAVFAGPRTRNDEWTDEAAVVVVVATKGFIPADEVAFSDEELALIDVVEGAASLLAPFEDGLPPYAGALWDPSWSPLAPGASIGAHTSGTLGPVVRRRHDASQKEFCVTCAHVISSGTVFAPSPYDAEFAKDNYRFAVTSTNIGTVVQPVSYFQDTVVSSQPPFVCTVDAALIEPCVQLSPGSGRAGVPPVSGHLTHANLASIAHSGLTVCKFGRTTGLTDGVLYGDDTCALRVGMLHHPHAEYAASSVAPLHSFGALTATVDKRELFGQYLVMSEIDPARRPFAQKGDSGAAVIVSGPDDYNGRVVGMVTAVVKFNRLLLTAVMPIEAVLQALDVDLVAHVL